MTFKGYHTTNGFKFIEVYKLGEYLYKFLFFTNGEITRETTTDDVNHYISHLSQDYYFCTKEA